MIWETASQADLRLKEIIFHLLGSDKRLLEFLFDPNSPRLRQRAGILKEDSWGFSHGEQIIVRTALELWSGSGHVFLWELIETLDDTNLKRVIEALIAVRALGVRLEGASRVKS